MTVPPVVQRVHRFLADPGGDRFDELALEVFAYQYEHNPPYRRLCDRRGARPGEIGSWRHAPMVPTEAFRHVELTTAPAVRVFRTSGTSGGARGEHHLPDLDLYRAAWRKPFLDHVLPDHRGMRVLSLVPSEEDLPDSSLSFMVARILETVGTEGSGTFLGTGGLDGKGLRAALDRAVAEDLPVLLVGTAFALVAFLDDLAARGGGYDLPGGSRVMDTGGFKGRARSVTREELMRLYRDLLGVPPAYVVGEYGMTELSSQFYETRLIDFLSSEDPEESVYEPPPSMRWRAVDPRDLSRVGPGDRGLLAVFDLANAWTVSSILTGDVVEPLERGFRLLGRATGDDLRGCSLTVEEILESGS
jgi:hypothetical protein